MAKITSLAELTDVASDDLFVVVDKSDTSMSDSGTDKKVQKVNLLKDCATLTGTQTLTNKTLTSPVINTGVSGTAILDEDDMASNSATKLATQQSIKAYVDTQRASIAVPYGVVDWSNTSANYSTASTSYGYFDQTNGKVTLTLKYGKLVRVDLIVEGLWNTNTAYSTWFDIGLDGTSTRSTSGDMTTATTAAWGANWTTDGTSRGIFVGTFFFVDCGTGSKSFYALWRTSNAGATAYAGQYAQHKLIVTELFM